MLRRHPTAIALTHEDIATYDDTHDQRAARLNQFWGAGENVDPHAAATSTHDGNDAADGRVDPSDELKPLPGPQGARGPGRSEQEIRREREGRIMGGGAR